MNFYCVPGTGLVAREQKEQGLCSNGTSRQREGDEEKTENTREFQIVRILGLDQNQIDNVLEKSGHFNLGNLGGLLQRGDVQI